MGRPFLLPHQSHPRRKCRERHTPLNRAQLVPLERSVHLRSSPRQMASTTSHPRTTPPLSLDRSPTLGLLCASAHRCGGRCPPPHSRSTVSLIQIVLLSSPSSYFPAPRG